MRSLLVFLPGPVNLASAKLGWGGPIGEGIAKALEQGYSSKTEPYHGYYFKILKGQGACRAARQDGLCRERFDDRRVCACRYAGRIPGHRCETFIVSYEGVVYEKDLGPDSLNIAKKMELYNPDRSWRVTNDGW